MERMSLVRSLVAAVMLMPIAGAMAAKYRSGLALHAAQGAATLARPSLERTGGGKYFDADGNPTYKVPG